MASEVESQIDNKLKRRLEQFPEDFVIKKNKMVCKSCNKVISYEFKKYADSHLLNETHKKCFEKCQLQGSNNFEHQEANSIDSEASSFKERANPTTKQVEFNEDLLETFLQANISLKKVDHPAIRKLFTKYVNYNDVVPQSTTLRNYLPKLYNEKIDKIREEVGENNIWISVEKTTDACTRYVLNVIIGVLNEKDPGKARILTCETLPTVNGKTMAALIENALQILWPSKMFYERVHVFTSVAAPYIVLAGKLLKQKFPNLVHITCLAHGLHRVAECIREQFKDVNSLISNVNKVFLKVLLRVNTFKTLYPDLRLPPEPVITR